MPLPLSPEPFPWDASPELHFQSLLRMHLRYRAWDTFTATSYKGDPESDFWLVLWGSRVQKARHLQSQEGNSRSWVARVWRKCPLHSGSNFFFFFFPQLLENIDLLELGGAWPCPSLTAEVDPYPHSCSCFDVLCDVHQLNREIVLTETDLDLIWQLTFGTIPKVPRRHPFTVNVQMSNMFHNHHQGFDNPQNKRESLTTLTWASIPTPWYISTFSFLQTAGYAKL